ncbi:PREDICTED: utrophin-like, partial [Leptosomus discolor]|uniref:utrophin-like n=1 Tax=Leptosomus discolor TaxID=188344 RepID=UPI000522BAED
NHRSQLDIFDENVAHISTWLYQAEALLDEIEKKSASKKEETVKRLTSELDDVSLRVDNVRDQAIILMNGRGMSCRELVEPKLAELNRNFEKVSQHIKSAKMLVGQERLPVMSEACEVRVAFPDLEKFECDIQNMLKVVEKHLELSGEDEKLDQERAQIEEVLQRGEQLLQQPMEDHKREKIRVQLLLLQKKYNSVQECRSFQRRQVVELSPVFSQYKKEHDSLMKWLDEAEHRLSGLQGVEDEQKLQAIPVQQRLKGHFVAGARTLPFSAEYLVEINKVLLAMADVELLLNAPELNTGIYEDFSTQEDALKNIKDILDKLGDQIAVIHEKQPDVILEASGPEAIQIGDALTQLNAEWDRINRMYNDRKCCFDRAIEVWRQFHCDLNDLSHWITEAEVLLADARGPDGSLELQTAGLHQQELEEGVSSHQTSVSALNRTGEGIIQKLSATDGSFLQEKLAGLNRRWKAITTEVMDRQQRLKGENQLLIEYRKKLDELRCWLENVENALDTRFTFDHEENLQELQVLSEEMEVQGDKLEWLNRAEPDVLLDKNVDLQEKDKLSDCLQSLNVRWNKVFREVPERVRELEAFVRQSRLVTQTKSSDAQKVVLVSSSLEIPVQTQQALELSAPADLDKTTTELADWLVLIDQMLKSNIVTVGNTEEINRTIARMKITKADLDQRHPQLDSVFTLAQNLKNKTSSSDIRTVITEKLEKVKNQWDNTQHGVEVRQQQLKYMLTDSMQWDEQRQEMAHLMEQCEIRLRMFLQAPKETLVKQISDNKLLVQDLHRGDITVAAFNDLSNKLLREYRDDDTRRVKETTDQMNTCWVNLNQRAVDRQNFLETELKTIQASHKDLESFLKWLQEAETTVNVLADASQRENTAQDSACIRELRKQMQHEALLCVNRLISAFRCILCGQSHQDKAVILQFARCLYAAVKHLGASMENGNNGTMENCSPFFIVLQSH